MNSSQEPVPVAADSKPVWGPYELRPSPQKMLFLTLGSSVAVATALVIPDAFAILPTAVTTQAWIMRVAGLWTNAYFLWAVGFLAILHLTRIVSGGIQLDSRGLKLWRLGKRIAWEDILATTISERKNFSRMLLISPGALELTLHVRKPGSEDGKVRFTVKKIPSFQYAPGEFASLIYYVGKFAFGVQPDAIGVYMFKRADSDALLKASQEGRIKRLILSSVISCSLLLFLARNAATNYTFNMGNVYVRKANYRKGIEFYTMSTAINPFFPPAWDRLARCNLRNGDPDSALENWQHALHVKPDFVESKLGVSSIYMRRWQLAEAEELIRQAVRLAPKEEAVYLNLSQLLSLQGKHREAIKILEQVIRQKLGREQAACLLAQCYLRVGEVDTASKILLDPKLKPDPQTMPFYSLVCAELDMAQGNLQSADQRLQKLFKGDRHVDLLLDQAKLRCEQGDLVSCERLLNETEKKQVSGRNLTVKEDNPFALLKRPAKTVTGAEPSSALTSTPNSTPAPGAPGQPAVTAVTAGPDTAATSATSGTKIGATTADPSTYNPWISYYRAKIAYKNGDKFNGAWMVEQAAKSHFPDPSVMASCAALLLDNGGSADRARELINEALKLDPENRIAKTVGLRLEAKDE